MENNRILVRDCSAGNLIKVMDAKIRITFFESKTDGKIFDGYVYQLYDNQEMQRKLDNMYIDDMIIDYNSVRVLCCDKWAEK